MYEKFSIKNESSNPYIIIWHSSLIPRYDLFPSIKYCKRSFIAITVKEYLIYYSSFPPSGQASFSGILCDNEMWGNVEEVS